MTDLTTTYLGLNLAHPVVPSASPLSRSLDGIKRLEDAGAPAVVMYSLFEEEIERDQHVLAHLTAQGNEAHAEALSYFPAHPGDDASEHYLKLIRAAKSATHIPIIGSLNGTTPGGWIDYARKIEQAGADALELNVYLIPTDAIVTGAYVESRYVDLLRSVCKEVKIPVAIKLSPYFSAMANMAQRLTDAGASGLVLFNRFYQPDIDLEQLCVTPNVVLSTSDELRLPLRWIAILYDRVRTDFAVTGGVHTHLDVLKAMMSGANVAMMTSELLQHGARRIQEIVSALHEWMEVHEYASIRQMIGSMSQRNVPLPQAYVRANYMRVLDSWRGSDAWEEQAGTMIYDANLNDDG
jgi:dihydroorotate dehydrogenase (fumarate)